MIILRIQYSIYQIARTSKASKSMQSKKAYESSCGIRTIDYLAHLPSIAMIVALLKEYTKL
jgi:hypothetical protein